MYMDDHDLHSRVMEHLWSAASLLAKQGIHVGEDYKFEAITLQGSQNYGTHYEGSDVDTKMVVTPTYKSLLKGVKFNKTLILENGEHCDVRTAHDMIANICKGNINWIEGLYTEYTNHMEGTWWADMRNLRDDIVGAHRLKIMSAVYGMAQQKLASLYKPTQTTQPYFDQHGFDNKNFIHIMRLRDFAGEFVNTQDFAKSVWFAERGAELMHLVRDGAYSAVEAETRARFVITEMDTIYHYAKKEWEAHDPSVDFKKRLEDRYVEWVV